MDLISATLLLLSASLAAVKNILIKSFVGFSIKNREFFGLQATIFGAGTIVLIFVNFFNFEGISLYTILLALIYGVMLLCAQWCYTIALTKGKTAICTTIYSFGFILPTLSGAIIWHEHITLFALLGILTIFPVLIISGADKKKQENHSTNRYIIPLIIALLCSGGLGIVQKIQQKSEYKNQTSTFILIAFIFSFVVSLLFFFIKKPGQKKTSKKSLGSCAIVGSFFAICNLLNTILAGRLDSAIFFPAINIGSILISTILGIIIYREKLTKRDIIVIFLGVIAIVLVNF